MKTQFITLTLTAFFSCLWVNVSLGTSFEIVKNSNGESVANYNFLVKAKEGSTSQDITTAVGGLGASVIHEYNYNDWYLVQFTSGDVDDNYEDLAALSDIAAVNYDYLITPNSYTPTEELFEYQWPLTYIGGGTVSTNTHEAWSITRGYNDDLRVGVYVLDSGFPGAGHADWDDYFVPPDLEYTDKLPATDVNGDVIQFCRGDYGFPFSGDGDMLGHATAMGGIIAAEHDGNELCGIAPETYLVSSNFLFRWENPVGCFVPAGLTSDALAGLEWVVDWNFNLPSYYWRRNNGLDEIRIVNASWSYYSNNDAPDALFELISGQLNDENVLVIASGGNHDSNPPQGSPLARPARWADDAQNILAVSAFDKDGNWAEYSRHELPVGGQPYYLIGGPGGLNGPYGQRWHCANSGNMVFNVDDDVLVDWLGEMSNYFGDGITNPTEYTDYYAGSSVATAHVSGVAALVVGLDASRNASELRDILIESAIIGDNENGAGRVNALRALLLTPADKTLEYDMNIPIDCYLVGNLIVPDGITLTIEPGVDMAFGTNAQIVVESGGKIKLQGTSANPITLRGAGGAAWKGIAANGGQVTLEWVNMKDVGSAHPSVFAQNSVQLGEIYPVYIANCIFEDRGIFLWGSPSLTTRVIDTEIRNVPVDAGLYLYNCSVLFDNVSVHDCDYINSYLKTISGTFYECSFEGQVSNYAVLCNSATCNPNFYCCEFTDLAPSSGSFKTSIFSATSCAPRIGGGSLNCRISDNSDYLVIVEGSGAKPWINSASNDFYQANGNGKFMEWRSYPTPAVQYSVSGQYWNPSPPTIAKFTPSNASYWKYSSYKTTANGLCGGAMSSPEPNGRIALDDEITDSLEVAIDLESEGEYGEAQELFVAIVDNTSDSQIRLLALSHIITTQAHLESPSGWIPEVIDDFIGSENNSYDAVVQGNRMKAVYYLQQENYTEAIELCTDLLESELTEQDEIYVSIDLLSIQMSAGIVEAGGTLDGTLLANVPEELRLSSIAQGIAKEDELLRSLGAEDEERPTNSGAVPAEFALMQNYPNPFNPTTQIEFDIPEAVRVSLKVFNTLGQEVAVISDAMMPAGHHVATWDGKSSAGTEVSTGLYIYQMQAGSFTDSKKMLLMK